MIISKVKQNIIIVTYNLCFWIDLSGESGVPGIDISEGLKQIEEKKQEVQEGLKVLVEQIDKLAEHATNFGEELDKQEKLLDGIKTDVEKYDNELGKMNKTMDKVLTAVGGPFRILYRNLRFFFFFNQ